MSYKITLDRIRRKSRKVERLEKELEETREQLRILAVKLERTCPHSNTRSVNNTEVCEICGHVEEVC